VTDVVSVIEPDLNHLLGAYLQSLSLRAHPAPIAYRLVVVARSRGIPQRIARWARDLGICCELRPARSDNPYFNRWLALEAFEELRGASHVALLDWDILYAPGPRLPGPVDGLVCGRRNPPGMYRRLLPALRGALPPALASGDGDLASSVNGGVLVASGPALARVAEKSSEWAARLLDGLAACEPWEREQLVTSVAVGEVGLAPLEERWNVTPLSPVADDQVALWHYNDGLDASRKLKRNLLRPGFVEATCRGLAGRWPGAIGRFEALYAEACRQRLFRAFLH
jgi:hypothetical protein